MLVVAMVASAFVAALGGTAGAALHAPPPGVTVSLSPGRLPLTPTAVLPLLPLVLTPSSGVVGSTVGAIGTSFSTNSTILFTFNGTLVNSTCATDWSGSFPGSTSTPCTFTVPTDPEGPYKVVASDVRNVVTGSVPAIGSGPRGVAYDSHLGELFVANFNSDSVSVINDTNDQVVAIIPVGANPSGVAYDPDLAEVFVANYNGGASGTVSVITDANDSVVATISVGSGPLGVAYDSRLQEVFVADSAGGSGDTVSVISAASRSGVANVTVGLGPTAVGYDPSNDTMFVANGAANTVSVIDDATNSVVRTVAVGGGPSSLAYDSVTAEVFVANAGSNTVDVISASTASLVTTVPVQNNPSGVAYDPAKAELFVTGAGTGGVGQVRVISDATDTVVQSLPVGRAPSGIVYDAGAHNVFVANYASDNVTLVFTGIQASALFTITAVPAPTYRVTFQETGLPRNESWSVMVHSASLGSLTRLSATATIQFVLGNGSYAYTVGGLADYAPQPLGGAFTVMGANVTIPVDFSTGYTVTFTESGSAPAPTWVLSVSGATTNVTGSSGTVKLPNGTFRFTIGAPAGYEPMSAAGILTVNGAPVSVQVPVTPTRAAYSVTFTQSGLPAGTMWSVTIGGFTVVGTGSTIPLTLGNGTALYTVGIPTGYSVTPSSGTLTVAGSGVNEPLSFTSTATTGSLGSLWVWIVAAIAMAAALISGAVVVFRRRRPPTT